MLWASTAIETWENVSPAIEPVKPAPASATTSAVAAKRGCSCCRALVYIPPRIRWKATSGQVCNCQREVLGMWLLLLFPPSPRQETWNGRSELSKESLVQGYLRCVELCLTLGQQRKVQGHFVTALGFLFLPGSTWPGSK